MGGSSNTWSRIFGKKIESKWQEDRKGSEFNLTSGVVPEPLLRRQWTRYWLQPSGKGVHYPESPWGWAGCSLLLRKGSSMLGVSYEVREQLLAALSIAPLLLLLPYLTEQLDFNTLSQFWAQCGPGVIDKFSFSHTAGKLWANLQQMYLLVVLQMQ